MPLVLLLLAVFLAPTALRADVKLAGIFGDHMVLQRDGTAPVWGTAAPGESVTVTAGNATGTATAGADGAWKVTLANLPASSQPLDVTVQGANRIVLHDVLVGDVWLCSGQSNMEFGIGNDASAPEEIAKASHPEIRLFFVHRSTSPSPVADLPSPAAPSTEGQWLVCSPETVKQNGWNGFSAVGYFFGRDIAAFTHAPVGLIGAYWGGTPGQAWTSLEALRAVPVLNHYADQAARHAQNLDKDAQDYQTVTLPKWKAETEQWEAANKEQWDAYQVAVQQYYQTVNAAQKAGKPLPPSSSKPSNPAPRMPRDPLTDPNFSTVLYNAMIAPIIPYGIKGALWYQGEANAGRPTEYAALLPALIGDWRARWGQGEFPFLIVQLANFQARKADPSESNWAALRESQAKTAAMPHNGLALSIDLGEAADIHPRDKDDVGARLALVARKVAYGDSDVVFSGPTYAGMTIEGDAVHLTFDHLGGGLAIGVPPAHFHSGEARPDASALRGFAVAGSDGKYAWANARIEGDAVIASSPQVLHPVSTRYDWADNPDGNLYNRDGLPAAPFRTDDAPAGEAATKPVASPPANP